MKYIDSPNRRAVAIALAAGGGANHRTHFIDLRFISVVDHQADGLESRDGRDHIRIDRRDNVELAGPGVEIVRPCEVTGEMRRPFRRHPVGREQAAMLR